MNKPNPSLTRYFIIFVAVIMTVRFVTLGIKSFWLDEAASIHFAQNYTMQEIWEVGVDGRHPPLYYLILHTLVPFGTSEWLMRLPSAIASLLNLGLLYFVARRLFPDKQWLPWIAITLLTVAPLEMWYAQEARMYTFVATMGLLIALGYVQNNITGSLLVFVGLAGGLYMDYTLIPLWVVLTSLWIIYWYKQGHAPSTALFMIIANILAWWLFRPWLPKLNLLLAEINEVVIFNKLQTLVGLPQFENTVYWITLAVVGIAIVSIVAVFLPFFQRPNVQCWLAPLIVGGFIGLTFVSALPRFYTIKRILVTGFPYIILLVAWAISFFLPSRLYKIWGTIAGISLILMVVVLAIPKDDWRGVVTYLNENVEETEVVWLDPYWNVLPYDRYQPRVLAQRGAKIEKLEELAQESPTIWLIAERFGSPSPTSPSEKWLDEHWQLILTYPFDRLEIRQYQSP